MDCYIYYQSKIEHSAQLIACVKELQLRLSPILNQAAILQRRPEVKDGAITWMEVYKNIPEDFAYLLSQALIDNQLSAFLLGARHLEYFVDAEQ